MKFICYDFDKTIYDGDSSVDFYFYCMRSHPALWRFIPKHLFYFVFYGLKIISKKKVKEILFNFVKGVKEIDVTVSQFWDQNQGKIKLWYKQKKHDTELVISASPEFLIIPICKRLNIEHVIATKMDPLSGKIEGENCYGEQKVIRFHENYAECSIEEFYSDSYSDSPLARLSKMSVLVTKDVLTPWDQSK